MEFKVGRITVGYINPEAIPVLERKVAEFLLKHGLPKNESKKDETIQENK